MDLFVSADPIGATVADVDLVIENQVTGGPSAIKKYEILLRSPDGDEVLIKGENDPQVVYYDQQRLTPGVPLIDFNDGTAQGTWQLEFTNRETQPIDVTLSRSDIRLHTQQAMTCLP